ncbi:hypothetical protein BXZ70DRAFT_496626 [Cristinia sonorae]|uniref:SET domain-containing protein n=1 Tax=Cristinia sonorae TaxID=1940300 RepID=A0A8K0UHH2_9AGAR|nr:hypothetical protein BXZ70DRAFT_496626 [Cristinia sonorae]
MDKDESLHHLIRTTYRQVWKEYYAWEQEYCRRALASLASPNAQEILSNLSSPSPTHLNAADNRQSSMTELSSDGHALTMHDLDGGATPTIIQCDSVHVESMAPSTPYESVAPLSQSIRHGDDPSCMPFIPYAETPEFDWKANVQEYTAGTAWQDTMQGQDPDLSCIILEVARRLHHEHGLQPQTLDATKILPLQLCWTQTQPGLLSLVNQTDLLAWSSAPGELPPGAVPPESNMLRHNLQNMITLFCPIMNCVQASCISHVNSGRVLPENITTSDGVELAHLDLKPEAPCGSECFLLKGWTGPAEPWSQLQRSDLKLVLSLDPESHSLPCDLAVICRKPCHEVNFYARELIASTAIQPSQSHNVMLRPIFRDYNPQEFTPVSPCHHAGPCSESSQCECFIQHLHCERNCGCSADCVRRWRGCKCGSNNRARAKGCGPKCPCVREGRECEPDLCLHCDFMPLNTQSAQADTCQNCQLQLGYFKATEVRKSEWGQGLFLLEDAKAGELIIEYLGELILEPTLITRDQVARFRGRNYVYGLDSEFNVDGSNAGNASRFINHSRTERNCDVKIHLVNGDHRLGVYALNDMNAGSELFLDYGNSFFDQGTQDDDA